MAGIELQVANHAVMYRWFPPVGLSPSFRRTCAIDFDGATARPNNASLYFDAATF